MKADWTNPEFQKALVQAHQERNGWPLLEESLICTSQMYVAEGWVTIDGSIVVEVGYNANQILSNVYPAMNYRTKVAWTNTPPAFGNNWTVVNDLDGPSDNRLCLYTTLPLPLLKTVGGSRRSRRHKRSNRVKKQKKRTRKY